MLYLGADHRGFLLKEEIRKFLESQGKQIEDLGALEFNMEDDYNDFAQAVAEKVMENLENNKGILICGSGHGMEIVANKSKGIRAAIAFNRQVAAQSREHEDANVLVLPSDWLKEGEAKEIVSIWFSKPFSGEERNVRRINKIGEMEQRNFK